MHDISPDADEDNALCSPQHMLFSPSTCPDRDHTALDDGWTRLLRPAIRLLRLSARTLQPCNLDDVDLLRFVLLLSRFGLLRLLFRRLVAGLPHVSTALRYGGSQLPGFLPQSSRARRSLRWFGQPSLLS